MSGDSVFTKCFHELEASLGAWTLGLVHPDCLPALATSCLARGIDVPALRLLAGVTPTDGAAKGALWERAVREIGLTIPDRRTAATLCARCICGLIVAGAVAPYVGARALTQASLAVGDPTFHELDPFIYASSEYEDRPAERAFFERAILEEAQRWSCR